MTPQVEAHDDSLGFFLRLNDGTDGRVILVDSEDGYFAMTCLNAFETMFPVDELSWMKAAATHDLVGAVTQYNGMTACMVAQTVRPQSLNELRADLGRFVTRIGLTAEAFRTATA